jgi:hypothetical protein
MHNVVIRLAEIYITVIYFSPRYSDPKYLGSLGRLEVFFWFEGDYSSRHHIWARPYHIFCQFGRRPEAYQPRGGSAGAMALEEHLRHVTEVWRPMHKGESNSNFN